MRLKTSQLVLREGSDDFTDIRYASGLIVSLEATWDQRDLYAKGQQVPFDARSHDHKIKPQRRRGGTHNRGNWSIRHVLHGMIILLRENSLRTTRTSLSLGH